jgi:TolB-like protein/DNA-binding winged helix-turn-helix (wHTH) protein/tetratricopeptide (TPR) repeat protein
MDQPDRRVRFGGFTFDPDTGELVRHGALVTRLQDQPCRVLDALTASAGRLVTRDELHTLLWPENSLVDADNGLNIAINKIRLALADRATTPRFIRTVPRRGYRFISEIAPAVAVPVVTPISSGPPSAGHARAIGLAITNLLAASIVVAISMHVPAIRSVAVLPFTNLAGDRALDDAAEGLTDTITTALAARGVTRVIAPETTAKYRHSDASPAQIARELHADAIVVGSLVRDGAGYSVNVRLIDGQSERHLWAKRFTRATTAELTFAEDIPAELTPVLGLARRAATLSAGTVEVPRAVRDEYLRKRYGNVATLQEEGAAVEHLTHALESDRENALAWAGLADLYASGSEAPSRLFAPWPGPTEAGVRAAQQALHLDPSLAEAHVALGQLRLYQLRWSDAEREFGEAVRLSPDYASARQWYALVLMRLQKCSSAVLQASTGLRLDPTDPLSTIEAGSVLAGCGQAKGAVAAFSKVLSAHPDFAMTRLQLAGAYFRLGDAAASLAEFRAAERLRPNNCEIPARIAHALEALGQHAEARSQAARVASFARFEPSIHYCTALANTSSGDVDGAFAALNAAVAAHEERLLFLLTDSHLGTLRVDPRWPALVERAGLAPYAQASAQVTPTLLIKPWR